MSVIFESKDAVFFVGGRGAKIGDQYAGGGCTKDFWGDINSPVKSLSDVMDANGGPLSATAAWSGSGNACTVTNNGSGKVRITKSDAFANCAAGLVANVSGLMVVFYPNGDDRYEVLAVDGSGNYIDIDLAYVADDTCDVKAGGAFETIQNASDNTTASSATPQNVYILTNKDETFTGAGDQIDLDTGQGTVVNNTDKYIIGIDADGKELAAGSYVTINADDNACHVFNIDGTGFELWHLWATNTDEAATHVGFYYVPSGAGYAVTLKHCKSTDCYQAVHTTNTSARLLTISGGYYEASNAEVIYSSSMWGFVCSGAVLKSLGNYPVIANQAYGTALVEDCILIGNGNVACVGISVTGGLVVHAKVSNCVMYNIGHGFDLNQGTCGLTEHNNIIVVADKTTGKAINRQSGNVIYSDHSCLWAVDGTPSAADRWGGCGKPEHAIEENPDFVDAATSNFRLRNPNVLRGGKPDMAGNVTQMGAVMQEYKFAKRAKTTNFGRLQTVR
jgi:hypothetical protein